MTEVTVLSTLTNAGAGVIIAVVCLFLIKRINDQHEKTLKRMTTNYESQLVTLTNRFCEIADRDIRSREEYAKVTQSLVDAIKHITDAAFERFK